MRGALDYMGLAPRPEADRHPRRPRVHRLLHQCAHRGSARRRRGARGPQGQGAGPRVARLDAGEAPGRSRKASTGSSATAGLEWAESGCSMCIGINGDIVPPGERCASTTNRNFRGRQGPGARTHLMSPAMVAAAAVTGHLADVRPMLAGSGVMRAIQNSAVSAADGLPARCCANVDTDQVISGALSEAAARRRARRHAVPRPALRCRTASARPDFPLNEPAWRKGADL